MKGKVGTNVFRFAQSWHEWSSLAAVSGASRYEADVPFPLICARCSLVITFNRQYTEDRTAKAVVTFVKERCLTTAAQETRPNENDYEEFEGKTFHVDVSDTRE